MGIRNKITKDGFVETLVDGDVGTFAHEQTFATGNVASGSAVVVPVATGLAVLSGAQITASLPALSTTAATDGTVANGFVCTLVLASAHTFMISASAPINGGAWTRETVAANSNTKTITCVGVTGLAGFGSGWLVSSGSIF